MSGGSKQQLKQFTIASAEDACLVLGSLISGVSVNLEKYKEYAAEAESLLETINGEYVPAKQYDDVNDKLLFRQREILRLTADHQKSSFSYMDLRKILEKSNYVSTPISAEVSSILSELLNVRNWSFHNPQSLIVAAKEVAEKRIPNELKGIASIVPQLNPVIIRKTIQYEIVQLASLVNHTQKRIEQFEKLLVSMKTDYEEIFATLENRPLLMTEHGLSDRVQYIEASGSVGFSDYHSDIAQISMAIQKSKYDGSKEKFEEWTTGSSSSDPIDD